MMIELSGKVGNTVSLKVEVVHVDIQTLTVVDIKLLLGVLEEESGLSDATRTLDTNQSVAPIDLIHQGTTNRSIGMLNEISMCPEKCLHCLELF